MALDSVVNVISTRKNFLAIKKSVNETAKMYVQAFCESLKTYLAGFNLKVVVGEDSLSFSIHDPSKQIYESDLTYSFKVIFSETEQDWFLQVRHNGKRNVYNDSLGKLPITVNGLYPEQLNEYSRPIHQEFELFLLKTLEDAP